MHPEICYVSVDNTGFNKVVLKPLANPLTASYVILREYSANQYTALDTIDGNTLEYIDSTSNPTAQSERYKVSAIDACGNGTDTSDYHKTVHLTKSLGTNGEINLIWNDYEGYQVSNYLIYRGSSLSDLNLLISISGTNSSYTDLNPPSGYVMYQIRAFTANCNALPNAFSLPDTLESNIIDHNNTGTTIPLKLVSVHRTQHVLHVMMVMFCKCNGRNNSIHFIFGVMVTQEPFNSNLGIGTYTSICF